MRSEHDTSQRAALEAFICPEPCSRYFTLDENDLEERCPLDNGRHNIDPEKDIGVLKRLPLEILSDILLQVDIRSLTDFRRINQRAMQVVESIPQYDTIVKHSPAVLRGILSIETGSLISCNDLFRTLCTPKCENCGDFGGFIYAITCSRTCLNCVHEEPKYSPLSVYETYLRFFLSRDEALLLPRMRNIPGLYSLDGQYCPVRCVLIDFESACRAGRDHYGSIKATDKYAMQKELVAYYTRVKRGELGPTPGRRQGADASVDHISHPTRFMAVIRAPWIEPSKGLVEWGFHCVGCQREREGRSRDCLRKFSVDTFNDHIKEYGRIMDGRHCSPVHVADD